MLAEDENLNTALEECEDQDPEVHPGQLKRFSLRELQFATDNFSIKKILGRGGFGKVYKGRLADGSLVTVKRMKEERTQERLLVYPCMVNGSVASCLRDKTDVFGYGMMLLELITGQRAFDLARLANNENVMLLEWVALLCTQNSTTKRPKMSEVIKMLEGGGLAERWEEWQTEGDGLGDGPDGWANRGEGWQTEVDGEDQDPEVHPEQQKRFSLHELQVATDNFSIINSLDLGCFGKVYKGRLADGSLVVIKRMKEGRTRDRELQFYTQIEINSIAVHRNLLPLRGFCTTSTERLLVYPCMVNGSVASRLRERPKTQPPLDWPIRKRSALGSARCLAYLNEECDVKIIHRDIKASNILLNDEFEAVVGDLGLAKLIDNLDTHFTTAVRGTIGYIAPEYLYNGKCSEKTDVFGYGIMLLELITGQRAFGLACVAYDHDAMLLDWIKGLLKEKKLETLVDADLQGNYAVDELEQLIQVALLCTHHSPTRRPKMSEVTKMLEGYGLAERWQEWQMEEMSRRNQINTTDWIFGDSISADELSRSR
ncbi:hypothetical protein ACH5RR_016420 [Cinchona calisaya]|uniref:non-specific serine/threonine protein kinase n=1 Tax=Cinchona calisaya TaxID=153742 RepID=A0ABD2ZXZ0_9GENT